MKRVATFILGLLVGVCFYISASRLIDVVTGSVPPGKVGECLKIFFPNPPARREEIVKVISNDRAHKVSVVRFKILDLGFIDQEVTFSDLRDLGAKRVNCEETN